MASTSMDTLMSETDQPEVIELRCPAGHLYGAIVDGVIELYDRRDKQGQRERGERVVLRWDRMTGKPLKERIEVRPNLAS